MTGNGNKRKMKWSAGLLALVLAVAIPVLAMAETATQTTAPANTTTSQTTQAQMMGRGGRGCGYGLGGYGLSVSSLTDEQKTAYNSAVALYEQVEDKVLNDLVTAGVVAQADVDAYNTLRANEKSLSELDQSSWTADQYKAFYEANEKTGDERTAAMQALVTAGQLTQAQADALSAESQDNLWTKISQNAGTNSAIQTALETMRQARQTMMSSLSAAGIQGMGKGGMFGGPGMGMGRGGMGNGFGYGQNNNGQNDNQNGNQNGMMRGGMGGRR